MIHDSSVSDSAGGTAHGHATHPHRHNHHRHGHGTSAHAPHGAGHGDLGSAALSRKHITLPELDMRFLRTARDIAANDAEISTIENAERLILVILSKESGGEHQYIDLEKAHDKSWSGSVRLKQGTYQYLFMVVPHDADHFLRPDKRSDGNERAHIEGEDRRVSLLKVTGRA